MVMAVTLHNIPEGMAVGVVYAGFLSGNTKITAASALALSCLLYTSDVYKRQGQAGAKTARRPKIR